MNAVDPALMVGGLWLLCGALVAAALASRGQPEATVVTALVAWPFLVSLVGRGEITGRAPTINAAIDGARDAIARMDGADTACLVDLEHLRRALHTLDRRLAPIEGALAAPVPQDDAALVEARRELEAAARHAAGEIAAVVAGLYHLRLQAGLAGLGGDDDITRRRIAELRARVAAVGKVA